MRQKLEDLNYIKSGFFYKGNPVLINKEYLALIPRLENEQRKALRESIKKDGLHESLVINKNNVLLDGHTRIEICKEVGIKPDFIVKNFISVDKEKKYVVVVNLKRRQLNPLQIVELTLDLYEKIKDETHKNHLENLSKTLNDKQQPIGSKQERSTVSKYGKEIGVSRSQVEKAIFILKNGTPEQISEVRDGYKPLYLAYNEINSKTTIRDTEEQQETELNLKEIQRTKEHYRSTIGIIYSILDGLEINSNEMMISAISRVSNLSHYAVLEKCALLKKNKLIEEFREGRNRYYRLTISGKEFKKKFNDFKIQLDKYELGKEL